MKPSAFYQNVSPFLLLLFPVFIMILLSITTSKANNPQEEVALKTNIPVKNLVIKICTP